MNMNPTNANNSNDDNVEAECADMIKTLFEKYPNMKQKIHHYIKNSLPSICENA